ncbi:LOW QUALITY PROTEIN: SH3 domain-containing protein 19-like [Lates calcarifer]|uniref:LOW QUALITY PROTEIN: SH3 domain-containing protein 19-like n=1 Tax=Lates calcarifer TaxID=8187 RepID=A0AAJ8BE56_LATCA|nr:LOW QUALITY PROTEIN: SH3 domain-containing protein 19-like [Lates calcarifer]
MAEARSEEEEENMMRDTREQVVRRQPNSSGGRPDRRKPEHRHSQGPLSSIRAAIKRTSTRSTSLSETSRDRDRERDRDRDRDRRRPEITILSAEPLASTSWFPGASAGFPPPPPPAAQIWGPTIPPSIQPPPSYEEVIREKTQEQVLLPSSSPGSSSSSSSRPVSTITIATQTDPGSAPEPPDPEVKRPVRPPRPRLPHPPKSSHVNDITTTSQSALASLNSNSVVPNTHPGTHSSTHTQCCDVLADLCSPLTLTTSAQTDQSDQPCAAVAVAAPPTTSSSSHVQLERPRPRPRSKLFAQPIGNEVKVQTLVKLREDGLATLAARARAEPANQEVSQGKYLQELLEAFSSDDWGFPERRSDSSGHSQSESEDGDEEEEEEDMATLKARIQAFEQQQQQVADGSCGDSNFVTKRPEPRPRPRLQGQPAKSAPPVVAPKPKNFSHAPKPSSKVFWEEGGLAAAASDSGGTEALKTAESPPADLNPKPPPATEPAPSCAPKSAPVLTPQPFKTTEKPPVTPKPQCSTETPPSSPRPAPVPAPRPPPPKLTPSLSDASSTAKPPPRPPVAPRASMGAPPQDKSPTAGRTTPTLPPRPSAEVGGGAQTETQTGGAETQDTANQSVKAGSVRPGIPTKPAALTSPRRASAPSLAPKPTVTSPTPPDPNPVPTKPAAAPATTPKPSGPTAPVPAKPPTPAPTPATTPAPAPAAAPTSALAPAPAPTPAPAPAPALRKGPAIPTKPETTSTANPNSSDPPLPPRPSGVKFLPLRPPPMKSIPGRPPPPAVNSSTSSANQIPPPSKTSPAPSVSPASQSSPSQTAPPPSSVTANQLQAQRAPKRGPPLPPRPKPGHPLYSSYTKQEVLIVLDDPSPAPSEHLSGEGKSQTTIAPLINPSQCLLDLDTQPEPVPDQDSQSKPALENLVLFSFVVQSILPVQPEQKEQPDPPPVSGPRCTALFDYEGEEEDELTFSQGDVIALLEVIGQEWGRGQIHGRIGIFPLNFVEVVEPLPQPVSSPGETTKTTSADTTVIESTAAPKTSQDPNSEAEEWAVALFDFPGQTAEDLSFHKGALIRVTEHIDAEWRRGRLEGREGLYPAAFTLPHQAESVPVQQSAVKGVAKALFEFTAESEDELSLKVGDIITQVESVDEQWILGAVGGKRGIVPKNYISLL